MMRYDGKLLRLDGVMHRPALSKARHEALASCKGSHLALCMAFWKANASETDNIYRFAGIRNPIYIAEWCRSGRVLPGASAQARRGACESWHLRFMPGLSRTSAELLYAEL